MSSVDDLTTNSGSHTTFQASTIATEGHLTINVGVGPNAEADAQLRLKTAKDTDYLDVQKFSDNGFWWKQHNYGHYKEQIHHALLTARDGFTINAPGGIVVEYKDHGNLDDSIAQLSQMPGLEYLAELRKRDDVNWVAVQEAYEQWDYKAQGLGGAASALIALAVALAMPEISFVAFESVALTTAVNTTLTVGLKTLVTRATLSMINHGGDLGAVFADLGSLDFLTDLAASMLTAGLTSGLTGALGLNIADPTLLERIQKGALEFAINTSVDTMVRGGDLGEVALANLRAIASEVGAGFLQNQIGDLAADLNLPDGNILKILAHAGVGAMAAEVMGGDPLKGAIAGAVAELAGAGVDRLGVTPRQQAALVQMIAALAIVAAGGDGADIGMAANIAALADRNNRQLHSEELKALKALAEIMATEDVTRKEGESLEDWQARLTDSENEWMRRLMVWTAP